MTESFEEVCARIGFDPKAPRITPEFIEHTIVHEEYFNFPGSTITVCKLTLFNGYSVLGESACASVENFNDELGRHVARKAAVAKIWPLAGFWLRQKLWQNETEQNGANSCFWIGDEDKRAVPMVNPLTLKDWTRPGMNDNPAVAAIDAMRDANLLVTTGTAADAHTHNEGPLEGPEVLHVQLNHPITREEIANVQAQLAADEETRRLIASSAIITEGIRQPVREAARRLVDDGLIPKAKHPYSAIAANCFNHGHITVEEFAAFGLIKDPAMFITAVNSSRMAAGSACIPNEVSAAFILNGRNKEDDSL